MNRTSRRQNGLRRLLPVELVMDDYRIGFSSLGTHHRLETKALVLEDG